MVLTIQMILSVASPKGRPKVARDASVCRVGCGCSPQRDTNKLVWWPLQYCLDDMTVRCEVLRLLCPRQLCRTLQAWIFLLSTPACLGAGGGCREGNKSSSCEIEAYRRRSRRDELRQRGSSVVALVVFLTLDSHARFALVLNGCV